VNRSILIVLCVLVAGCKDDKKQSAAGGTSTTQPTQVRLTLDWKPEPEFGGFYSAKQTGEFARHGLDVEIRSAGPGAPTWMLVATGKTDFATTAADQVLIARSQNADVVAIFATYQTSPQGIMTHKSRGFSSLKDVFASPGTLAAEDNTWLKHCRQQFAPIKVILTGYSGGIAPFLIKPDYSQQCFIFSEPIIAKRQSPSSDPQTFLVAESGYNPYTTVVVTSGTTLREHPERVRAMFEACQTGWRKYLDDPTSANQMMFELNRDMDLETFAAAAVAQKSLIETDETKKLGLGCMIEPRWTTLGEQLVNLNVIKQAPSAKECFVDLQTLH
jgi:NitT/TauT family transport system substrate-binding protein